MKWMILRIENLALKEKYAELAKAIRKKNQFVKKNYTISGVTPHLPLVDTTGKNPFFDVLP